jgi:hypothetical protein
MPFPAPFMEFWDMHTNRKILRCPVWALKAYPRVQNDATKVVAKFRRMLSQAKINALNFRITLAKNLLRFFCAPAFDAHPKIDGLINLIALASRKNCPIRSPLSDLSSALFDI